MNSVPSGPVPALGPLPAAPASSWSERMQSPTGRLLLIGLLFLILQIPLSMIKSLVSERQATRNAAVVEVTGKWGGPQQIAGPLLRIPYWQRYQVGDKEERRIQFAYVLPETLDVSAQMQSEIRKRGIFEVPVYTAQMKLKGRFKRPDLSRWVSAPELIDWSKAELILGIADARAIQAGSQLEWAGHPLKFEPSTGQIQEPTMAGIHVPIGRNLPQMFESGTSDYAISLQFNGAESLSVAPVGEQTSARLESDWPHPSFQGSGLPADSRISLDGFQANWSVSYLGRDYPQQWTSPSDYPGAMPKSQFGVSLATPVDTYRLAERITKYSVLTLVFTFLTIWLVEVLSGQRLHVIQYLLLGSALSLFGLLQLAFAEHLGFALAFLIAATAIAGMVTLYSWTVLQRLGRALAVGATLSGLYGYLYVILQAEDYALLGGSIALFAALAVVMVLTRRVDWQGVERPSSPPPATSDG